MKTVSVDDLNNYPHSEVPHWLPPVDHQDVWASGVTYERSREARQEEAVDGGDVYTRVYSAKRPELFFKARGERVVGHLDYVGIRTDSDWNVPEPELALVINPAMEVVGLTIGNDMSSRSIEGENPLYLPQAKIYDASCALGPVILPWHDNKWPSMTITVEIERAQHTVFKNSIPTERIHRSMDELVDYLGRSNKHPHGVVLLTGTGIVPSLDFSLKAGDTISITVTSIGTLTNTVQVV
jgi:2-dehydro-3-deoxy-D-arabinonate dehydratase